MEKSTIIGLVVGVLSVIIGMALKGAPVSALANPAAFMIIFVGTAGALFNAFPMDKIKKFPTVFKLLFKLQEHMSKFDMLKLFVELSQIARREGILALEGRLEEIKDPFLKNA